MESGVVPPPRRSTSKSLVGGKEPRRQSDSGASGGLRPAPHGDISEDTMMREKELLRMLDMESGEKRRLQMALKEQTAKFERSVSHQSHLEEELVSRDARIQVLGDELRILKQRKQMSDSELAQSTADYMNGQAKWLEQVDQLNDEIQLLKAKLSDSTSVNKQLEKEVTEFREKERQREAEEQNQAMKASRPDNVQVAADTLEKHQNELLVKELRARHNQIRSELEDIRSVNDRLREDNEHFQYLLVEHTVSGNLPGIASDPAGGQTLADEEVFDFDPTPAESAGASGVADSSLADEGDTQSSPLTSASAVSDVENEKDIKSLERTINQQQFELQSLRNHNRALKLSLERLVDRLLDNPAFSHAVEESVSTNIVQKFRQRVASSTASLDRQLGAASSRAESVASSGGGGPAIPASTWSNMIFNAQHTGTPNRRVLSLGVDSEYPGPSPIVPQHTGNTVRTVSTSASVDGGSAGRMRYQFGRTRNLSPPSVHSPDDSPTRIQVAKRTDSQNGLRKLRLRE